MNERDIYCPHCDFRVRRMSKEEGGNESKKTFEPVPLSSRRPLMGDRYDRNQSHRHQNDYGPNSRRRVKNDERLAKKRRYSNDWPPPFESDGASYIFDSRSGLFYEGSSNFFFDPKTKFYFSCKEQKYYQLCPKNGKHSFSEVTHVDNQTEKSESNANKEEIGVSTSDGLKNSSASNKKCDKRKIEISLKTKSIDTKSSSNVSNPVSSLDISSNKQVTPTKDSTTVSKVQQEHHVDMEKWSERDRESNKASQTKKSPQVSNNLVTAKDMSKEKSSVDNVKLTLTGKPICVLCKRKFGNVEKLKQHEQFSAMHKQNLAKEEMSSAEKVKTETVLMEYRDRAKERRTMHGPGQQIIHSSDVNEFQTVSVNEKQISDESLGNENIGNKMLHKLGWKGGSLGRTSPQAPSIERDKNITSEKLKQDWERIESITNKHNSASNKYGRR